MRIGILLAAVTALIPGLSPAQGAFAPRPHLDWRTISTAHFVVHYPEEMGEWARAVAERLEGVRGAVAQAVGFTPAERVTVVIDDPMSSANGAAFPLIGEPAIVLWPTPPGPAPDNGHNRGWGEILAVHEFVHVAHLTRPTRNPRARLLSRLAPVRTSPITLTAPRWLYEGYATYLEGRLTGSGRPHGVVRAAILRQWALEGRLPTYGQLNSVEGFFGGSMAYLVGSAFLEWLVARRGDSSLVHLWRRMSARRVRSFDEAFAGIYGGAPPDLYGRFAAELTGKALAVEDTLRRAGLDTGETVQRLTWYTGAPALSRDDSLIAIVLRSRTRPSRVVVWRTVDTADTARARKARERLLARDPEDVPAVEYQPRPKQPVATLLPVAGRAHDQPRFFADGRRLLVSRLEPVGDGAWRPDLFIWDWKGRTLRRVTRGAAVRDADPSPDGRRAVGVRCLNGICDVVTVDLASGRVAVLVRGSPLEGYSRPRWSPDGRAIVLARKQRDRWRVAVMRAEDPGSLRDVDPDDGASRYDPAFVGDGTRIVAVSEAGGVANIETLDIAGCGAEGAAVRGDSAPRGGPPPNDTMRATAHRHTILAAPAASTCPAASPHPLTRVTGGAFGPAPTADGRWVYFLSLHAKGLDLSRAAADRTGWGVGARAPALVLDARLAPAVPSPSPPAADTFPTTPVSQPRTYVLGPRRHRLFPGGAAGADGRAVTLALVSTDPVGRLTWLLQGAYGDAGMWRGAGVSAAWRGARPAIGGDVFYARQHPSQQHPSRQRTGDVAPPSLDVDYRGAHLAAALAHDGGARQGRARAGVSAGSLAHRDGDGGGRHLAFAELAGGMAERDGPRSLSLAASLHGAVGSTAGSGWQRGVGTVGVRARVLGPALRGSLTYGRVRGGGPFEQFVVGGVRAPLFDGALLSQRLASPALPVGVAGGRTAMAVRAAAALGVLEPFVWAASAGDALTRWHRLVGAERALDVETLPLLHLANVLAVAGVAYSLDEPFRHKVRGYVSLTYRP